MDYNKHAETEIVVSRRIFLERLQCSTLFFSFFRDHFQVFVK